MKRFFYWIKSFKRLKTCDEALTLKLSFGKNLFGDEINTFNCRSFWVDKYFNVYYCDELYNSL